MTAGVCSLWYRSIPDLETRQRRVLQCIADHPGVSSRDIARLNRMEQGNVCRRIGELRAAG